MPWIRIPGKCHVPQTLVPTQSRQCEFFQLCITEHLFLKFRLTPKRSIGYNSSLGRRFLFCSSTVAQAAVLLIHVLRFCWDLRKCFPVWYRAILINACLRGLIKRLEFLLSFQVLAWFSTTTEEVQSEEMAYSWAQKCWGVLHSRFPLTHEQKQFKLDLCSCSFGRKTDV